MTDRELLTVTRQLAECLADIKTSLGGALGGSRVSLSIVRDALMRATSAVDGTPLGPLTWDEPSPEDDPRSWGPWADQMTFCLADDSDIILAPADQLLAV